MKKATPTRQSEDESTLGRVSGGEWLTKQLARRPERLPELFVSLHDLIAMQAPQSTYQEAAQIVKRLLVNEDDAPPWRKFTNRSERGSLLDSREYVGFTLAEWGMRLLENAAQWAEPVQFDPDYDYGHDHFETLALPIYELMVY